MIKNALHIYRKNIWNVFAILGFLCLGIFIGVFVVLPAFNNSAYVMYNKVVSTAKTAFTDLDVNKFFKILTEEINKLDWANPVRTLRILFENNGLLAIIKTALQECDMGAEAIAEISGSLSSIIRDFGSSTLSQFYILLSLVFVTSAVGYLGTKIVIQINSTYDRNILRFISSLFLNLIALFGIVVLLLLALLTLKGVGLFFACLGVFILMLIASLVISIICYKKKDIKLFDILNFKNLLFLFLSSLIVFSLSFVILVIIYIFSDLIALLLSIPFILITTIIVENIVVADITNKYYLTNKKN